ncbi:hypothetical protein K7W42_06060 [Deinococcus sp. HMF7604]|uniref:hypothetical protein n=1 Tax=Deinococcus betulae TaxID=2873312 RepID=UPI001CCEF99D|nr:hypothetical protein [Deinococcus betulae]MBZ9750423.1 hypothetical protein [Deinococcus betulae]
MKNVLMTAAVVSASFAAAQTSGQPQMSAEQRARMTQMQAVMDLAQTVRLLPELEKNKTTALTKAQAKVLLPILTTIQKAASVQPNDAKKYLTQIEDKVLTSKQLTALDTLMLKAEKEREAQRAQRQAGSQGGQARIPGVPGGFLPGQGQGQRPSGQAGQGAQAARDGQAQGGQPGQFNPFKQGRSADDLKKYIAALQKK